MDDNVIEKPELTQGIRHAAVQTLLPPDIAQGILSIAHLDMGQNAELSGWLVLAAAARLEQTPQDLLRGLASIWEERYDETTWPQLRAAIQELLDAVPVGAQVIYAVPVGETDGEDGEPTESAKRSLL